MPHNVESMFYAGQVPWHGLGVGVEHCLTSAEAIGAAGLDWEVGLTPVYVNSGRGLMKIEGKMATVRKSDSRPLGVVTNSYKPIQNREAFDFMDSLIPSGEVTYETAGSLRLGEQVWMLARLNEEINVKGDVVNPYLLITTSHDGTGACRIVPTTVRVVCNNTLNIALGKAETTVKIVHNGDVNSKLSMAREVLELGVKSIRQFQQVADCLSEVDGAALFDPMAQMMLPAPKPADPMLVLPARTLSAMQAAVTTHGKTLETLRSFFNAEDGSAWGLLNAYTGFADHNSRVYVKAGRDQNDARMDTLMFGQKAAFKRKALNGLVDLAGIKTN